MSNVFEFKLQSADLKTVDVDKLSQGAIEAKDKISKELSDFMAEMKAKIDTIDVKQEAENLFKSFPMYVDGPRMTVQVGEAYIKAKDQQDFQHIVDTINESIAKANSEVVAITQKFQEEKREVADNTSKEMKEISYPSFGDLTLLQAEYARHPEYVSRTENTREEKKLNRLSERFADANSDKARRRVSRKIEKTADKIADRRADTAENMANAAADYSLGEELQNQAWYYNDIIHALTEDARSSRVHYTGDSIFIDTYHPIFRNTVNLKGTIRLTGALVEQYKSRESLEKGNRKLTIEEQRWIVEHPEDAEVINKGGIIGGLVDGLVKHTNFPPESAQGLKSAAKIGAIIGLGFLGWKTIKKIFNIGGKNKKGEGLAWGLGAAGVLIGIPALTGQRIDQLLFSGDSKQAWEKIKSLGGKLGIETDNIFGNTNEVIHAAMGNLMYGNMTYEDAARYIEYKDGKYILKTEEYEKYLIIKRDAATDAAEKQSRTDKLALLKKAKENKTEQVITDCFCKKVNFKDTTDKKALCETAYKAYLDGLALGASLLEGDKKLKISDKAAFDTYIHKQIVDKKRDPSSITKDELKKEGLLVEVVTTGNRNTENTGNNTGQQAPANEPEKSNREEFKEWGEPKWNAFKKAVKNAGASVSAFATSLFTGEIFHKGDSAELAARRAELKRLKKELADLKKQETVADRTVITAKEIELTEMEIDHADQILAEIAALSLEDIDPGMVNRINPTTKEKLLEWLPEKQKKELTFAKKKLNLQLKFETQNDKAKLQAYTDNTLRLKSCGENTIIRFDNGHYYLDKFMVPFNDAESVVRLANLTNFIKVNFANRATTNVDKIWSIDGNGDIDFDQKTRLDAAKEGDRRGLSDITVVDGEDGYKSAIREIGGDVFESRKSEYVQYLNNLKDKNGKDMRVMKNETGMVPEDLKSLESKFTNDLKIIKGIAGGTLYRPEKPDDYEGELSIYDKSAKLETVGGYLTLKSHKQKINILPSGDDAYRVGYVNGKEEDGMYKGNILEIDFHSPADALKMANLINFYQEIYKGYGSSEDKPFNISWMGSDLEFAEAGIDPIDIDALPNGVANEQYGIHNNRDMLTLKDWLNGLGGR